MGRKRRRWRRWKALRGEIDRPGRIVAWADWREEPKNFSSGKMEKPANRGEESQ